MIIDVIYDSSVSGAPAAFKTAISTAIQFLENIFTNPITITIDVGYGEINGQPMSGGALGESETFFNSYSYPQIRNALAQNARSADQISAVNSLPGSDPTSGGHYWMATAEAKALGLMASSSATDGFIGLSSSVTWDYDPSNGITPGTYDFNGTFLHELTEVMGRELFVGSAGIGPNAYTPLDLFHYSAPGVRTFSGTTTGYFSLDGGATNLDNFNTNPSGDFGDWAASAGHDSFLAFSSSGVVNPVTQTDLRMMNVLGYNESTTPSWSWSRVVITGNDFDGDGRSDILFQNSNDTNALIDLLNGPNITSSATITNPNGLHVMASGDFNHDGKADVILQGSDGAPQIWLMNGTSVATVVSTAALDSPGSTWHVVATGDFNADGNADILWQNDNGTAGIWLMNGTSISSEVGLSMNPGPSWHAITTGDFNGDGRADILWQNDNGTPGIWLMNGTSISAFAGLMNPGPTWHIVGTADFNSDSRSDILWQNDNGTVGVWEMNGTSIQSFFALSDNPGPTWHVKGVGDFNGDGKPDILFQNDNGTPAIWEMNGTSIIVESAITNPGAAWLLRGGSAPSGDSSPAMSLDERGAFGAAPQPILFPDNKHFFGDPSSAAGLNDPGALGLAPVPTLFPNNEPLSAGPLLAVSLNDPGAFGAAPESTLLPGNEPTSTAQVFRTTT